jgi:ABC-type sugar transport system permease subunit
MRRQIRKNLIWYIFVAPSFILFGLFVVYPTFEAFRLSFMREVVTQQEFVGFWQYTRLLTNEIFLGAVVNTVILGLAFLIIVMPLSLVIASLINNLRIAPSLFKVIYFLPQVTATVAIALIFKYLLQPEWGLVNGLLRALGFESLPLWLADPRPVLTGSRGAVTLLAVWISLGYYMLIFLAGLQAIPAELYDAALVDGAGPLQTWWHVTIPSLRPSFIFLILTGIIEAMSRFNDVWMLGGPGGSPARSLQTIVVYMYQVGFVSNDFNLAAATAVVLFIIVLTLTLINFRAFLYQEFSSR